MPGNTLVCLVDSIHKDVVQREILTKDFIQPQQGVDAIRVAGVLDNRADFIAERIAHINGVSCFRRVTALIVAR